LSQAKVCSTNHSEEEKAKTLQAKLAGSAELTGLEASPVVHEVLRSPGHPPDTPPRLLRAALRARF
jgi:hypothetical protein